MHALGYGRYNSNIADLGEYAHRIAYFLTFDQLPPKGQVFHTCNNRKCCNPDHLTIGTPSVVYDFDVSSNLRNI